MNNKGLVAAVLVIVLGIVIVAAVLMLSKRRVATQKAAVKQSSSSNTWSNIGSLFGGLIGGAASSWKPGTNTPSVGGKQVNTQTGDFMYMGVPVTTNPPMAPTTYGGYTGGVSGSGGSMTYNPLTPDETAQRSLYDQAIFEGYTPEEAKIYL